MLASRLGRGPAPVHVRQFAKLPRSQRAHGPSKNVLLAVLAALLLAGCNPFAPKPLDTLWDAPRFTLTDETGQPFSSDALAGQVWLADFIYTNCPDECPLYLSPKMAQLQRDILSQNLAGKVSLISITVDPRRDTPAVLKDYAARYGADPRVWHFLTGPDSTVQPLLQTGFKVGAALPADTVQVGAGTPEPGASSGTGGSYTLLHSSYFLLVDKQGKVRADYDGVQVAAADMLKGIQELVNER